MDRFLENFMVLKVCFRYLKLANNYTNDQLLSE
jgi:hypothetical protein